jgi:hypothetical protein
MGPYCKWHKSIVCFFFCSPKLPFYPYVRYPLQACCINWKFPKKNHSWLIDNIYFLLAKLCQKEKFLNPTFENEVIVLKHSPLWLHQQIPMKKTAYYALSTDLYKPNAPWTFETIDNKRNMVKTEFYIIWSGGDNTSLPSKLWHDEYHHHHHHHDDEYRGQLQHMSVE